MILYSLIPVTHRNPVIRPDPEPAVDHKRRKAPDYLIIGMRIANIQIRLISLIRVLRDFIFSAVLFIHFYYSSRISVSKFVPMVKNDKDYCKKMINSVYHMKKEFVISFYSGIRPVKKCRAATL